jgi:Pyruvate/2-oxoacid:ferredoxin oxidoreductase delta subunit
VTLHETQLNVEIDAEECKGCALCVETCPEQILALSSCFNHAGYHPVEVVAAGCTGCGLCFYCCPEPGAIRIVRRAATDFGAVPV